MVVDIDIKKSRDKETALHWNVVLCFPSVFLTSVVEKRMDNFHLDFVNQSLLYYDVISRRQIHKYHLK